MSARRGRRPWWILPIFGSVPDLEPRLVRLLGLVALALLFESYDISMLTSALHFIARDLGMHEHDLGGYMSVIRLGALPAFLLVPLTDRIGRRRAFLITIVGTSVGTTLTALAWTPLQFVVVQMATRTFLLAGVSVAIVIITEEFPAAHRGWALGMAGALAATGYGLGAVLFAVIDHLPYGWRALYVVGAVPLLLLPMFRREVRETGRFTHHRARSGAATGAWYRPLVALAVTHPWRALGIASSAGCFAFGQASVYQFTGYFLQTAHGWTPGEYSTLVLLGGALGVIGNVVAGRVGDRVGRRGVGAVLLGVYPLFAFLFYRGDGTIVPAAWICIVFCESGGWVILRALAAELFPTSHRATSTGLLALVQTLGAAGGLALVGAGTQAPGDIARMTSLLSLGVLGGGLAVLALPETGRRELEAISGDGDERSLPA